MITTLISLFCRLSIFTFALLMCALFSCQTSEVDEIFDTSLGDSEYLPPTFIYKGVKYDGRKL